VVFESEFFAVKHFNENFYVEQLIKPLTHTLTLRCRTLRTHTRLSVAHWHLYVKIKYNNSLVTGLLHLLLLGWPGIQLSKHFDVCISPAVAITIFIDRRVLINCLNYIRLLLLLLLFAGPTRKASASNRTRELWKNNCAAASDQSASWALFSNTLSFFRSSLCSLEECTFWGATSGDYNNNWLYE